MAGFAVDLMGAHSPDLRMLNLGQALVRGTLPARQGDALLSEELAQRLGVGIGETATLICATRHGSLTTANFTVSGTVRFGLSVLDRGTIIADLSDVQDALDMYDAAGEVFGFFPRTLSGRDSRKDGGDIQCPGPDGTRTNLPL